MTIETPDWLSILRTQTAQRSNAAVARELNYSATTISLALHGKYAGSTAKLARAVLTRYTRVDCPHLETSIPRHRCVAIAGSRAPTHNPLKMQHWRACRRCPLNPDDKEGV